MDQPHHSSHDQTSPAPIVVRLAAPMEPPSFRAWEVVRDGVVIHAATSEGGAMDFAHGLTGSPLRRQG